MRHRNLAAIVATATVATTPALATVIEDVTTAPPAAADSPGVQIRPGCELSWPGQTWTKGANGEPQPDKVGVVMWAYPWFEPCQLPGTLSLQASADHSHWKTLAQVHQNSWWQEGPTNPCLAGTWWYQGYFVADDGSFTGGTDSAFPTRFTC